LKAPGTSVAILAVTMGGCCKLPWGGDFERPLPHGFELARANSEDIAILAPNNGPTVVASTVMLIATRGDYVTGFSRPRLYASGVVSVPESGNAEASDPGYFFIDTRSAVAWQGMNRKDWLAKLQQHGVKEPIIFEYIQ
jgi:hypothetical protein